MSTLNSSHFLPPPTVGAVTLFRRLERAVESSLGAWLGGRFKFEFLSVKCVLLSDTHCENVNKLFVVIKRVINMEVAQKERLSFFEVRI